MSEVPGPVNDWFNAIMMTVNVFPVLTTVFLRLIWRRGSFDLTLNSKLTYSHHYICTLLSYFGIFSLLSLKRYLHESGLTNLGCFSQSLHWRIAEKSIFTMTQLMKFGGSGSKT